MITLQNYTSQNTKGIAGLSNQLCAEAVKMGFLEEILLGNILTDSDSLVHLYLHPHALIQLKKISSELTGNLIISTAYRTLAQQYILKQNLLTLVAPVGKSDHGSGKCFDATNWKEHFKLLNKYGYHQTYGDRDSVHFDCEYVPDNRSNTILAFQRLWNRNTRPFSLNETGVMTPSTLTALAITPINGFINAETPRFLSVGDNGKDVGTAQAILIKAKLYSGAYDGIFGNGMFKSVSDFQSKYGLVENGIIDAMTHSRLMDYPDLEPVVKTI